MKQEGLPVPPETGPEEGPERPEFAAFVDWVGEKRPSRTALASALSRLLKESVVACSGP